MPEKVHKKFGDELNTHNGSISTKPNSATNINGLKRSRDGSPKSSTPTTDLNSNGKTQQLVANENNGHLAGHKFEARSKNGTTTEWTGMGGALHKVVVKGAEGKARTTKTNTGSQAQVIGSTTQTLRKVAAQLEATRKELPIWSKKSNIRWALRNNDILLVNGETGSGKSTQVPQYLYTEPWCRRRKVKIETEDGEEKEIMVGGMIAITQPRRVAAITLAHRVATEMGSALVKGGGPGVVGYSVRFNSLVPPGTKIKFVTEGILLQEMLHDPNLRKYSAVIVDEIHERSVDVDLISGFLRTVLHGDKKGRGGIPLKVVVMSATLDLGGIEAFFAKPDTQPSYVPGKTNGRTFASHMVEGDVDGALESYQMRRTSNESSSSWNGFSDSDDHEPTGLSIQTSVDIRPENKKSPASGTYHNGTDSEESDDNIFQIGDVSANGVAVEYVQGRQYEVEIIYEPNPISDYLHIMLQTILQLHIKEPLPGDILAFLTGQEEIETLRVELESYSEKLVKTVPRMKIMPLYGSLNAQAQQDAFEKLKQPFTRKIVLATNIAETSVTVSGVRYVIDCGKSKVKQYRPRLGMESLLAKPISRVSAIQRAGRAGREAKGKCFRLYTEEDYLKLEQDELPEILRSDVVEAVLKMKARGVDNVLTFPLMDSPDPLAMEKALIQLHTMNALDDLADLTDIGKKMASYPLPAAYGRVLIAAADSHSDVLLEAIDVISCLNTDSDVFLQPKSEEERENISEARSDIQSRDGDIITLLNTIKRYTAESADRGEWCRQHLVSLRAMRMAMQIRKQVRQLCSSQGLLKIAPEPDPKPFEAINHERASILIKSFLKAFAFKTAMLGPDGSYVTTQGRNRISIHPSSVLYGRKCEAIMFLEHIFTTKNYARKVSAIEAHWIEEAFL